MVDPFILIFIYFAYVNLVRSMLAAPLIAGNDLRNMSQATIDVKFLLSYFFIKLTLYQILTAPEVIAVDQDPLGKQGRRVRFILYIIFISS